MSKREMARLQVLIDRAIAANNIANSATAKLMEYSRDRYGAEPGDIDADYILDGLGMTGSLGGDLTAEDYHEIMSRD